MGTWIVGALVLAVTVFAGYSVFKDKKDGKGCGGGCSGCQSCPNAEKKDGL